MLTLVQRSTVYERVAHFVNIANDEYHHNMSAPHVRFDKRGTCGGTANHHSMELNFNAGLMVDNWDEFMDQIIPHEVAHLVKNVVFGTSRRGRMMSSHGGYWKQIMQVFGLNPDRTHSMDVTKVQMPKRKYIYECDGCKKEFVISSVRHNKMVRGTKDYSHCRGTKLSFVKPLGKISNADAMDRKKPGFMKVVADVNKKLAKASKAATKKATEPKHGTKIRYALYAYKLAKNANPDITRQEMITALVNAMNIDRKAAAGYYQNCKKRAA